MMTSRTSNPEALLFWLVFSCYLHLLSLFFYHVYILLAGLFRDKPHVYMLLNHLYSVSCKYTHEQTFSYLHAWLRSADDGEWKDESWYSGWCVEDDGEWKDESWYSGWCVESLERKWCAGRYPPCHLSREASPSTLNCYVIRGRLIYDEPPHLGWNGPSQDHLMNFCGDKPVLHYYGNQMHVRDEVVVTDQHTQLLKPNKMRGMGKRWLIGPLHSSNQTM